MEKVRSTPHCSLPRDTKPQPAAGLSTPISIINTISITNIISRATPICTHRREEARAGRLVDPQQQPDEDDEVVLDEGLVQQRVQHAGAEDGAGGERQPEHARDVRAAVLLALKQPARVSGGAPAGLRAAIAAVGPGQLSVIGAPRDDGHRGAARRRSHTGRAEHITRYPGPGQLPVIGAPRDDGHRGAARRRSHTGRAEHITRYPGPGQLPVIGAPRDDGHTGRAAHITGTEGLSEGGGKGALP